MLRVVRRAAVRARGVRHFDGARGSRAVHSERRVDVSRTAMGRTVQQAQEGLADERQRTEIVMRNRGMVADSRYNSAFISADQQDRNAAAAAALEAQRAAAGGRRPTAEEREAAAAAGGVLPGNPDPSGATSSAQLNGSGGAAEIKYATPWDWFLSLTDFEKIALGVLMFFLVAGLMPC